MNSKLTRCSGMAFAGMAGLLMLAAMPAASGADLVRANIPFSFQAAGKMLPAGEYTIEINRQEESVAVEPVGRGSGALEPIITYMAEPPHTTAADAHLVFDKVGDTYILSEVWRPGAAGVLLHSTSGPHEHHILHVK